MKVLLLGEYSNLHWTLAQGLRHLGCEVTVASSGDKFKNYTRDINLKRKSYKTIDTIRYIFNLTRNFYYFKGYDVVQIINPYFLDLKANKNLYAFNYLKKHNGKVFMGAFGDDAYWLKACLDKDIFRYSEFSIPNRLEMLPSAKKLVQLWSNPDNIRLNRVIAEKCDGIISCLYEYHVSYKQDYSEKLQYIPEPINTSDICFRHRDKVSDKLKFFIGIQKDRSEIKGTDVMYRVLKDLKADYPDKCDIFKAESIPYYEYVKMREGSDVILDQLYSYSPGMNALSAMAQGMVVAGGGEPEIFDLLGEYENRPIVNLIPTAENIYSKLEELIKQTSVISQLSYNSRSFVEKHHDYIKVAKQYIDAWMKL